MQTKPALSAVEIEEALLGAVLIDPDILQAREAQQLKPDDFFLEKNGWIWEVMRRLEQHGTAVDTVTVASVLHQAGKLDEIGGSAYLTLLINRAPLFGFGVAGYSTLLRRVAWRRAAEQTGCDIAALANDGTLDSPTALDKIEEKIAALRETLPEGEIYLEGGEAIDYYRDVLASRNQSLVPSIITLPWEGFAPVAPGVKPGKIVVVSGFTGEGKTILVEGISDWQAMLGHRLLYISTELDREDWLDRLTCRYTGLLYADVIAPTESAEQLITRLTQQVGGWLGNIDYWETGGANARAVFAQMRRAYQHGVRQFVIDYIWEIPVTPPRGTSPKQAYDSFIRELHTFARRTGSTIFIASQLTQTEFGPSTYGSRVLEQKSALHIRLETEKAKKAQIYSVDDRLIVVKKGQTSPMLKAKVVKNTFGPRGDVTLFKDGERFRFLDESQVSVSDVVDESDLETHAASELKRIKLNEPLDLEGF